MWQFIALIVVGLIQVALGFAGIDHHLGAFWAFAALVVALWLRFLLPITIGSYFGAVDVMGWEWYIGLAVAAPGLFFILPSMVMVALDGMTANAQDKKSTVNSNLFEPSNKNTNEIKYSSMTKNSQTEVITHAYKSPGINSRPKFSPPSLDDTVAAQILLKHDESVKSTIQGLDGLPAEIVEQVLIEIVKHPSENPQTVRNRAILVALGRPDMKWSDEFDLIIRKCKDAEIEDVTEFFHVFPVLSKRMAPMEVFRKLITEKVSEFYVTAASGKQILVTKHGINSFTFQSHLGQKKFDTIEEVYEYLGTPNSKRK